MSGPIETEQTSNWTTVSKPYETFQIDSHFSIFPTTYVEYIRAKNVQKGRLKGSYVDLPELPFTSKRGTAVSVKTITGHEDAYGAYLRAIIEHSFLDQKPFSHILGSFLTEILISSPDGLLEFWLRLRSNTAEEAKFSADINEGKPGRILYDEYQDGVVIGEIKKGFIHFLDTPHEFGADYELDDDDYNICFPLNEFQMKFSENQRILKSLTDRLTQEIGVDVWTNPIEKTPNFGTETWEPKKPFMIDEIDNLKRTVRNFYYKFF